MLWRCPQLQPILPYAENGKQCRFEACGRNVHLVAVSSRACRSSPRHLTEWCLRGCSHMRPPLNEEKALQDTSVHPPTRYQSLAFLPFCHSRRSAESKTHGPTILAGRRLEKGNQQHMQRLEKTRC